MKLTRHLHHHSLEKNKDQSQRPCEANGPSPTPIDHFDESITSAAASFLSGKGERTKLRIMQELNVNDLNRHRKKNADRLYNLSEGTALFIALDKKKYGESDEYVTGAEVRLNALNKAKEQNPLSKVYFVESVGVAEAGAGLYATVPVFNAHGASIGLGFGFLAGVILRYRSSYLVVGDESAHTSKCRYLPLNVKAARSMEAGQEFEICGQARLRADATIAARYGADAGLAVLGAQLAINASTIAAAEYSITVISLNGDNKVRVLIRKIDQSTSAIGFNAPVGLIIPSNRLFGGNTGLPQLGHGILKYFADHKGNASFESYLTDFTSLTLAGSINAQVKYTHICAYDLDLNHTEACAAYDALIRLDIKNAKTHTDISHGVIKVHFKEHQKLKRSALRLTLFAERLYLRDVSRVRSSGRMSDPLGSVKQYRDRSYKKHKENWISKSSDISWESVLINPDQGEPQNYFHFTYQRMNFITRQKHIDKFFRFGEIIGVEQIEEGNADILRMRILKRLLSKRDDTLLRVDLFFEQKGVLRLKLAQREAIYEAHLHTLGAHHPALLGHPALSIEEDQKKYAHQYYKKYHHYRRTKASLTPQALKALKKLKNEYTQNFNRNLSKDYAAHRKAHKFSKLINRLLQREHKAIALDRLFPSLGKHGRPSYRETLPTLIALAGRENVLVHNLSASGGGVKLSARDEGTLEHPRDYMDKLCLRA